MGYNQKGLRVANKNTKMIHNLQLNRRGVSAYFLFNFYIYFFVISIVLHIHFFYFENEI